MPLFLFTGEEYTLLLGELTKRKTSFLDKYGEHGLFDFASDNLDFSQLQNALMSGGMFATKKLVIIRGIPLDSTPHNKAKAADIDRCLQLLEGFIVSQDTETIVVCVSYKPDKRTKPYKRFVTHAQLKEFPFLDDKQKMSYITQHLGTLLTPTQQQELLFTCGSDLGHLTHECNKLVHYANYHHLTTYTDEQFRQIVRGAATSNNFALLDHLYTDTKKSIELIKRAQQAGEDMFQFLGMLYRGVKITINVLNLHEHGVTDAKQLASTLKAHPFVVSKQLKLLPQLQAKKEALFQLYSDILQLDFEIKSGILPAEGFWLAVKQAVGKMG